MTIITNINTKNSCYTTCNIIEINGLDSDTGTYRSCECHSENLKDMLNRLATNNRYGIQKASIARKGDRNHAAKYFKIPITNIIRVFSYDEARSVNRENGMVIYARKDNDEYILIGEQTYIIIVRLYIIAHELNDNTMPYYYSRDGKPVSAISFNFDMFFSDSKQAYHRQQHVYDATRIREIFTDPENDARTIIENVY